MYTIMQNVTIRTIKSCHAMLSVSESFMHIIICSSHYFQMNIRDRSELCLYKEYFSIFDALCVLKLTL